MKRYFFLITFVITGNLLLGQQARMTKVFKHHNQSCSMIGTNEEMYVIQLFSDSTIRAIRYRTGYKDHYNSVIQEINAGRYSLKNDTLTATYETRTCQTNYKRKPASFGTHPPAFHVVTFYAPTQFAIHGASAIPVFGMIPILEEMAVADYGLDYLFEHLEGSSKVFGME